MAQYRPGLRPSASQKAGGRSRGMCANSVSIMVLPTKNTRSSLDAAPPEIVAGRLAGRKEPVRHGVGDDAIDLLRHRPVPERIPASTCATGTPALRATTAQASDEFTSPTTRHRSLGSCARSFS